MLIETRRMIEDAGMPVRGSPGGDDYHFMDTDSYEQIHMSSEVLGDAVNYIIEHQG